MGRCGAVRYLHSGLLLRELPQFIYVVFDARRPIMTWTGSTEDPVTGRVHLSVLGKRLVSRMDGLVTEWSGTHDTTPG